MLFWAYFGSFLDSLLALTGANYFLFFSKNNKKIPILHAHTKNFCKFFCWWQTDRRTTWHIEVGALPNKQHPVCKLFFKKGLFSWTCQKSFFSTPYVSISGATLKELLWLLNFVILQICKMLQKPMLPFPIDYFKGTNFQVLNFANLRSTTKFNTRKNHIDCKISQRLQNFNTGKSFQEKMEKYCSFMFLSIKHFFFEKY